MGCIQIKPNNQNFHSRRMQKSKKPQSPMTPMSPGTPKLVLKKPQFEIKNHKLRTIYEVQPSAEVSY